MKRRSRSNSAVGAIFGAAAVVFASSCMSGESPSSVEHASPELRSTVEADALVMSARARFPLANHVPAIGPAVAALALRDGWITPTRSDKVDLAIEMGHADSFRLTDRTSGVAIAVALQGANEVSGEIGSGLVVHRKALAHGDSMIRPTVDGTEDFVLFDSAPELERLTFVVTLGDRVAGLRAVEGAIEFVDAGGAPRLRVAPPWATDASGADLESRLTLEGCTADTSPAAPWGRPILPPGSRQCSIHVTWSRGAQYPVLVDPAWTATGSMMNGRNDHGATLVGSLTLVAGGQSTPAATATAELYDPTSGTWAVTGSMATARMRFTLTPIAGGLVLVAGGFKTGGGVQASSELYNPATGLWSAAGNLGTGRQDHTASLLGSGKVLVAGGSAPAILASAELFDPVAKTWSPTGPLNVGRQDHAASVLQSGEVLVTGGSGAASSAELYNPATGTFSVTANLLFGRDHHTSTVLASGKVLVAGGDVTQAELFDPGTGLFTQTGSTSVAHFQGRATALPNGDVLIEGGFSAGVSLNVAEVFDPTSGIFLAMGPLVQARYAHTATLLSDGSVLLAGGFDAISTAERYQTLPPGVACVGSPDCVSGFCVDGVCCSTPCTGICQACSAAKKGSGADGVCGPIAAGTDPDADCKDDGSPSCAKDGLCDGTGQCQSYAGPSCIPKPCAGNGDCTSGACADGICCDSACAGVCVACTAAKKGAGVDGICGNVALATDPDAECTDTGAASCGTTGVCGAGACAQYTANTPCGTSCAGGTLSALGCSGPASCAAVLSTSSCFPNLCSGVSCGTSCVDDTQCDPAAYCRADHTCQPDQSGGAACVSASQCATSQCADGVCCDMACGTSCVACTAALKGSGADGVCGPIPLNPKSACPVDGMKCGADGLCDGKGSCDTKAIDGTPSGPASCAANLLQENVCEGGTPTTKTVPCVSFKCTADGTACRTSCASDDDCQSDSYCTGGICAPKKAQGEACGASECGAGLTCSTDKVCCDTPCDSPCQACNLPGTLGTCTILKAGPQHQGEACSTDPDCGGSCDGTNPGCKVAAVGKACGMPACANGGVAQSECTASGKCEPTPVTSCNEWACIDGACKTSCASNADCASGYDCIGAKCVDSHSVGAVCVDDHTQSMGGVEQTCKPFFACVGTACVTKCVTNAGCLDPNVCNAGTCEPPPDAVADAGAPSGCGCSVPDPRRGPGGALALVLAIGLLRIRRRSRRTRAAAAMLMASAGLVACSAGDVEPPGAATRALPQTADAGLDSRSPTAPVADDVGAVIEAVRARFWVPRIAGRTGRTRGMEWGSAIPPGVASTFTPLDPDRLRPTFPISQDPDTRVARVDMPRVASGWIRVEDVGSGLAVKTRLRGADAIELATHAGLALYRRAYAGFDMIHRPSLVGDEDYLVFSREPAEAAVVYDIDVRGVSGLRLVADTLELVDASGTPRLRLAPPSLVDAKGHIWPAHLSVEECAYDTNPVSPWGHPIRHPGADTCVVRIAWSSVDVTYPALLDPAWTTTGSMVLARQDHTAGLLASGQVLVVGGSPSPQTAELYNPASGTWASAAAPLFGCTYHTETVLKSGKVLVAGGSAGSSAQIYDPSSGAWTLLSPMKSARMQHTATMLVSGDVILAGGDSGLGSSEVFAAATSTFTLSGTMNEPFRDTSTATLLANGKVLVAGGCCSGIATAELYDPTAGTWTPTGSMAAGRGIAGAAALQGSAHVVIAGGFDGANDLASVERYDQATGVFTTLPSLADAREAFTATLLGSGKILVAFGVNGNGTIATGEVFDPLASTWTKTAASIARDSHTATLLGSGSVLAAGGADFTTVLSSAVLFALGAQGSTCSTPGDCLAGPCVDGVCCDTACGGLCQGCSIAKKGYAPSGTCGPITKGLDPDSECADEGAASCGTDGSCDGSGACDGYAAGTVCVQSCTGAVLTTSTCQSPNVCGPPTAKACDPYACNGIQCATSCFNDTQCAVPDYCDVPSSSCKPDLAGGAACTKAAECPNGNCVDGVCCDSACAGSCQACSALKKGGGIDGTCGPVAAGLDPDGDCIDQWPSCGLTGACDGAGVCAQHPVGVPCTPGSCKVASDCQSGSCSDGVCCDTLCSGTCQACSAAKKGTGTDGTCGSIAAGTDPDSECIDDWPACGQTGNCDGQNACAKQPNMAQCQAGTCASAADCASGFCVDGVCCNTLCDGDCSVCAAALGAMVNGTCAAAPADTNPRGACVADPNNQPCGADGLCDGSSTACRLAAPATKVCISPTCAVDELTTGHCNDGGNCIKATKDCSGYLCADATSCATSCATTADCKDAYCAGTQCVALEAQGSKCTENDECQSMFCVDGVCCDQACNGQCQACSAAGVCGPAGAGKPTGTGKTCGADPKCAGVCDGKSNDCIYPDETTSCAAVECANGNAIDHVCNGAGVCSTQMGKCGAYACGATGCKTACASNADCAQNSVCFETKCGLPANTQCDGEHTLTSNGATVLDCAPYRCSGAECITACVTVDDCVLPNICDTGKCVPPPTAPTAPGADAGCGCETVGAPAPQRGLFLLLLAGLALRRRAPHRGRARRSRGARTAI